MISKTHRFHGYNSLNFAYRKTRPIKGKGLSLRAIKNPRRKTFRVAVVVSRKVHKSAVKRNRIRRRIYEIIRKEHNINKPYDLIIMVYDGFLADIDSQKLSAEITRLFKKAGVIK